jgi:hypothetical protein
MDRGVGSVQVIEQPVGQPEKRHGIRETLKNSLTVRSVAAAIVLVIVAAVIFDQDPNSFRRKFAEVLLQLGLIGVLGALIAAYVRSVFDKYSDMRAREVQKLSAQLAKEEQDRVKRLDFLRRMRGVHSTVAAAQWLIRAHDTRSTYIEQVRNLTLATAELWEIHEDLKAAKSLFEPYDSDICDGVRGIIGFLEEGAVEYETLVKGAGRDTNVDESLTTMDQHGTPWLTEFLRRPDEEERQLPVKYDVSLKQSKGRMRFYIYGPED